MSFSSNARTYAGSSLDRDLGRPGRRDTRLRPALVLTLLFALLLGLAYPLLLTAIGQLAFPDQANGSVVRDGGRIVGSRLIGQGFTADRYFHPRPSAAGKGYDALASAGSNLGPASQALHDRVAADMAALRPNAGADGRIPADLVTASASGLDPDISPASALLQVARVARTRGIGEAPIRRLVEEAVSSARRRGSRSTSCRCARLASGGAGAPTRLRRRAWNSPSRNWSCSAPRCRRATPPTAPGTSYPLVAAPSPVRACGVRSFPAAGIGS